LVVLAGAVTPQRLQGMALGTMGLALADVTDAASKYLLSLQLAAVRKEATRLGLTLVE